MGGAYHPAGYYGFWGVALGYVFGAAGLDVEAFASLGEGFVGSVVAEVVFVAHVFGLFIGHLGAGLAINEGCKAVGCALGVSCFEYQAGVRIHVVTAITTSAGQSHRAGTAL